MLPTYGTPFRHASDALKWRESTRKQAAVPPYANPYYTPADCAHNVVGNHDGNHQAECCSGNRSGNTADSARAGLSAPCCGPASRYAHHQAGSGAR